MACKGACKLTVRRAMPQRACLCVGLGEELGRSGQAAMLKESWGCSWSSPGYACLHASGQFVKPGDELLLTETDMGVHNRA